jgi:protein-S-isoprenylcysteine O-methyltransferase Ste14
MVQRGTGAFAGERFAANISGVNDPGARATNPASAALKMKAFAGMVFLAVAMGTCLFIPAGTIRYVEAWGFLAIFFGCSLAITLYLARRDPDLLARRVKAGPIAEGQARQKVIQGLAQVAFLATMILPALDHRFSWSRVPPVLVAVGDLLVGLGFLIVFLVFRENTFASAVVEVSAEQRIVDTGPYARVRHPMYSGALVLLAGMPLALGSFWGLAVLVPFVAIIVWRLLEEEAFMSKNLPGYDAYRERTAYRLIPRVW